MNKTVITIASMKLRGLLMLSGQESKNGSVQLVTLSMVEILQYSDFYITERKLNLFTMFRRL